MQSLGEIELRVPAVRAKISVFCVRLGLSARVVQTSDGLWIDFDDVFSAFFRIDCSFRCTTYFSFLSLGGATIFAKLRSKIAKAPKIGGKVCAHHFVKIAERF